MADVLSFQLESGARAVQLFDTWAGELSEEDYRLWALPAVSRAIGGIRRRGAPVLLYVKGCSHLVEAMAESGADVLSIDWRLPLREARGRLPGRPLQGNLDPGALLGTPEEVDRRTRQMIAETGGRAHIVNLGHGSSGRAHRVRRGVLSRPPDRQRRLRSPREREREGNRRRPARPVEALQRAGPSLHLLSDGARLEEDLGRPSTSAHSPSRPGIPLSLYLHLPFCETLCYFCACTVVITGASHAPESDYLDTLEREIDWVGPRAGARPVVQLHLGGGTPTYFSPERLERLVGLLRNRFSFAADAELGVEVDPRVTTGNHLEALWRLGFNRLSMGVQTSTLGPASINRVQPYRRPEPSSRRRAPSGPEREPGLIYGLPHQTPETFSATIDRVLESGRTGSRSIPTRTFPG